MRIERRFDPLLSAGLSEVVPGIIIAFAFKIARAFGVTLEDVFQYEETK